jgi:hypothetical protein
VEAIEECERLFRDTKLRVSTDQIGLARLPEGLELVRIGSPQRHERRALEGELAALEQEWRDAEEIAAIADTLTLPEGIDERVWALKRSRASFRPS